MLGYNKIVNPESNKFVNINSKLGRNILLKFINAYQNKDNLQTGGGPNIQLNNSMVLQYQHIGGNISCAAVSLNYLVGSAGVEPVRDLNRRAMTRAGVTDNDILNAVLKFERLATTDVDNYAVIDSNGLTTMQSYANYLPMFGGTRRTSPYTWYQLGYILDGIFSTLLPGYGKILSYGRGYDCSHGGHVVVIAKTGGRGTPVLIDSQFCNDTFMHPIHNMDELVTSGHFYKGMTSIIRKFEQEAVSDITEFCGGLTIDHVDGAFQRDPRWAVVAAPPQLATELSIESVLNIGYRVKGYWPDDDGGTGWSWLSGTIVQETDVVYTVLYDNEESRNSAVGDLEPDFLQTGLVAGIRVAGYWPDYGWLSGTIVQETELGYNVKYDTGVTIDSDVRYMKTDFLQTGLEAGIRVVGYWPDDDWLSGSIVGETALGYMVLYDNGEESRDSLRDYMRLDPIKSGLGEGIRVAGYWPDDGWLSGSIVGETALGYMVLYDNGEESRDSLRDYMRLDPIKSGLEAGIRVAGYWPDFPWILGTIENITPIGYNVKYDRQLDSDDPINSNKYYLRLVDPN